MENKKDLIEARLQVPESVTEQTYLPAAADTTRAVFELYYKMFQHSPVSIWVEDFSDVEIHFESLRRKGVRNFRSYFEAHPEDVVALAGKVRVIDVNEVTLRLYEAESRESFLHGLNIVFDKQSYVTFKEELIALADGRTEFSSEALNRTLSGKELKVLLHLVVLPGSEDSLSQVVVQIVDITAISKREDELIRSEEKIPQDLSACP